MEPVEKQVPEPEQPQVPAEPRRPESPKSSPAPAVQGAMASGQDLSGERQLPSPRPARLRVAPLSLGYGAFRRQASTGPEPPSPGAAAAEQPRDGGTPGSELVPWAAPGEPAPSAWAPVELQVDVRVKPVGAAGSSRAPSPAPSARFITVPVPESPAFSRHAAPASPLPPRSSSSGSTWGSGAQAAAVREERGGVDAEGRASPAQGGAASRGAPTCRCGCQERELEEDDALLRRAQEDGDKKLHRVVALIGEHALPGRGPRSLRSPHPTQQPPSAGPLQRGA